MWNKTTDDFIAHLRQHNLRRAYVATDTSGQLRCSHTSLQAFAEDVANCADFCAHQACFFEIGSASNHLLAAFVHDTTRGQAAGGVRFWQYDRLGDFVRDGLRLSRAMGQKCALAGLWWGGGKGVISKQRAADYTAQDRRAAVYEDFGRMISGLCGCYVTAEDVGTTPDDMARVFSKTRFTSCIPPKFGGSGNPSVLTGYGVVVAMEAALSFSGGQSLAGKTVAIQGLGQVSTTVIAELLKRDIGRVVAVDVAAAAVSAARAQFTDNRVELRHVDVNDMSIFAEACDIVAPNAVGAMLNDQTIPTIRAAIVCGGANNQLADVARDGAALAHRGILYVPDFLGNRMGIVNAANEQYGYIADDPVIKQHLERDAADGIFQRCLQVFRAAHASGRSTAYEAEQLADHLAQQPHPLWPNRGTQIIEHLLHSNWAAGE